MNIGFLRDLPPEMLSQFVWLYQEVLKYVADNTQLETKSVRNTTTKDN